MLKENLEKTGNNLNWLENNLKKQGISNIKKIFLATCDNQNNLSVYVKLDKKNKHDFFEWGKRGLSPFSSFAKNFSIIVIF